MSDNDDLADELAAFLGTIPSLVSVIPIARTIRSPGGLPLLVESITVFSTGGTIRYSLVGVDMASDVLPWEGITWTLADDLGTEYQTQGGGGRRGRDDHDHARRLPPGTPRRRHLAPALHGRRGHPDRPHPGRGGHLTMSAAAADVVVVGLGLIGAGALRHLAAGGVDVVGIGPGEPADWADHQGVFASHYDSGRITRKLDRRFEWAELAARSIAAYPEIAEIGGEEFHTPVGTVFASADQDHIARLAAVGRRVRADHTLLGSAATGLPTTSDGRVLVDDGRLALPTGTTVVSEAAPAGFIDPRRMLVAQLRAAIHHGARTVDAEVRSIEPSGTRWRITTASDQVVDAGAVLVATGAHTSELPLAAGAFRGIVRPETVVLATLDDAERERLAGMPSVLAHLGTGSFADLYQVPPTTYPDGSVRLKLGATLRAWEPLGTGAERRAWMSGTDHQRHHAELRDLVEQLVPGVRALSWTTKPCMITDTPVGLPTVDHLGPGAVLAAGGNGYAAKSADAIGALAAGLLLEQRWTDPVLDPEPFRLSQAWRRA